MLSFLQTKIAEENILGEIVGKQNCSFLDLGTGNGHALFRLREGEEEGEGDEEGEEGWGGRMMGVDYSARSIEFARRIAVDKGFGPDDGTKEVEFAHWDIMTQCPSPAVLNGVNTAGWDVVLDKGTFDAISLSEEKDERGRRICEGYRERVLPLIREGGVLLVTSCNWTEEELVGWFVRGSGEGEGEGEGQGGGKLVVEDKIAYRSFSFGGMKGQSVSSVCFRKVENL